MQQTTNDTKSVGSDDSKASKKGRKKYKEVVDGIPSDKLQDEEFEETPFVATTWADICWWLCCCCASSDNPSELDKSLLPGGSERTLKLDYALDDPETLKRAATASPRELELKGKEDEISAGKDTGVRVGGRPPASAHYVPAAISAGESGGISMVEGTLFSSSSSSFTPVGAVAPVLPPQSRGVG